MAKSLYYNDNIWVLRNMTTTFVLSTTKLNRISEAWFLVSNLLILRPSWHWQMSTNGEDENNFDTIYLIGGLSGKYYYLWNFLLSFNLWIYRLMKFVCMKLKKIFKQKSDLGTKSSKAEAPFFIFFSAKPFGFKAQTLMVVSIYFYEKCLRQCFSVCNNYFSSLCITGTLYI